ncbi:MAG: 50S ribosomal protein L23 [Candidatus Niyogibacteria bacterium]|nr:50S ribosomal protein L23 [Candidatus Niyogibacteria bacterium]
MALLDFFKKKLTRQKLSGESLDGHAREKLTRLADGSPRFGEAGEPRRTRPAVDPSRRWQAEAEAKQDDRDAAPVPPVREVAPAGASRTAGILLERPHITEKTARSAEGGTYVFRVSPIATRPAIRKAIEELYHVRVRRVNTVSIPSRAVKHWRHPGHRPAFRKAIVTLEKGHMIEYV